jgi:hypothetical protein
MRSKNKQRADYIWWIEEILTDAQVAFVDLYE